MKRNFTIVSLGYYAKLCFADQQTAIQFYQLVSQAIPVDSHYGKLPNGRDGVQYIKEDGMPTLELCTVSEDKVELNFSEKELKERAEAGADVDGDVRLVSDVIDVPALEHF